MKNLLTIFAVVMTCLTACDKPDVTEPDDKQEQTGNNGNENGETPSEGEGEGETQKVKSMTITLERVGATTAYFKASTTKTAPDIEMGIYYSTDEIEHIYDCERVWDYDLENGTCVLVIEDLKPNTTYHYIPYIFMNGERVLGDALSFTTTDYFITVDAIVDGIEVTFTGYADLEGEGGVIYSTESQLTIENNIGRIDSVSDEFIYTIVLSEFTTYFYCSFHWDDDINDYAYGQVKKFTTGKYRDKYLEANKNLSLTSAIDLSLNGTANCYIVSEPGLYKIKGVKGNDEKQTLSNAYTPTILWETFGTDICPSCFDLIEAVCYKNDYMIFKTSSVYKEGNAVIAVKDEDETILWSWHIWFTDHPQEQVYYNDAGTMMDRNIGAISATQDDVGALGLYFQWGRKDPFIGSSSIHEALDAKSTIIWPSPVELDATVSTIEYSIANPTTFLLNEPHYNNDTLDNPWITSSADKSIYDPCPVGWCLPKSCEVWSSAFCLGDFYHSGSKSGHNFSGLLGDYETIWYPTGGINDNGRLYVGSSGSFWTANTSSERWANYFFITSEGDVYPYWGSFSGGGKSVRCFKETE